MADTIKVRIEYSGGPGHAARIVDADTGALIEGAFHLEIDAKDGPPVATITAYAYELDITTDARVIKICPECRRDIEALEAAEEDSIPRSEQRDWNALAASHGNAPLFPDLLADQEPEGGE